MTVQQADTRPATPRTAPAPSSGAVWGLAPGVHAHGEVGGSGLTKPSYLVERGDGQMMQVSELLYFVLKEAESPRTTTDLAGAISEATGRTLSSEGLEHLVTTKLQPLGLLRDVTSALPTQQAARSNPLLSLRVKGTLVPAKVVRPVARVLTFLYWPPIVIAAIMTSIGLDVLLLRHGNPLDALTQVLATPTFLLMMFALFAAGAFVHEFGHAVGCRAGGAEPGAIGMGIYVMLPAFYTDVTQSYKLGRGGRLRTDLGGLYFNVWCLIGLGTAYLATGQPVLLLVAVMMHFEMAQQLLPIVRFDGYFVLADLAGVPDLFSRVRPVLRSMRPGIDPDPRVAELRPRARRLITVWVFLVVPTLVVGVGWLVWNLPTIVMTTVDAIVAQWQLLQAAWASTDVVMLVLGVLSIVILSVPLVGLAVLAPRLVAAPVIWARARRRPANAVAARRSPTAAAFTDEAMLVARRPAPTMGWRYVVFRASGGHVNLGAGRRERHRQALVQRVRAPIDGTRRVLVMSRKGGVGKTTVTFGLGATAARLRGDRVVALDANPDAGNLGHRVNEQRVDPQGRHLVGGTVTDVLREVEDITSYAQLRGFTAQTVETPLEVLASDDDPKISTALDRSDYHRVTTLLDTFYNLILIDTGTGILDSAHQGLIGEADQLVLVVRPSLDGGRAGALTLDWLQEHGYERLVADAVVVVNASRRQRGMPLKPLEEHFGARCRQVCRVPWDPALETGGKTALSDLRPRTRLALAELAAAVADGFAAPGRDQSVVGAGVEASVEGTVEGARQSLG